MLEKWLRPMYQRHVINPLIPLFSRLFTPCQTTIIAGALGIAAGLVLPWHYTRLATMLLLLSGMFDTLDGSIARHTFETSSFGCVLDVFTDRVVECAIILGLFFIDTSQRAIPSLLMLVSILLCVTSFLVVGIFTSDENTGKGFYYSVGLIERFEAFIFFLAMIWLTRFFTPIAYLFASLVFITAFIRLYQFKTRVVDVNQTK